MTIEAAVAAHGVVAPETHMLRAQGPFQIRRIRPGVTLGRADDAGFGGLGLIDHARLLPGLVVRMHEHRNDEIISYLRTGRMQHTDSIGTSEIVSPNRLMVMNAGRSFLHEEAVVGDGPIDMLQMFVRPEVEDLVAGIQFVSLDKAESIDQWRLLVGPVGSAAPSSVRQALYLYDSHVAAGTSVEMPSILGFDQWLYVFRGEVQVGGQSASTHTALIFASDRPALTLTATSESDLVLFLEHDHL